VTRTFIDSGVLVVAARGTEADSERALAILVDRNREFASSLFVRLELLPKAIYHRKMDEAEFYQSFFDAVQYWATDIEQLFQQSYEIACQYGLAALDALHIAAALSVDAEEFITTERTTKPMHRVTALKIISIASSELCS